MTISVWDCQLGVLGLCRTPVSSQANLAPNVACAIPVTCLLNFPSFVGGFALIFLSFKTVRSAGQDVNADVDWLSVGSNCRERHTREAAVDEWWRYLTRDRKGCGFNSRFFFFFFFFFFAFAAFHTWSTGFEVKCVALSSSSLLPCSFSCREVC